MFLHKENTLWFVPQETDASLSAKEIFIGTQHDDTVTFTQVKTGIGESWVISRCKEVVDDFSIEKLMETHKTPFTPDKSTDQADIVDSHLEHSAAATTITPTPTISAEELDSIHHQAIHQASAQKTPQQKSLI